MKWGRAKEQSGHGVMNYKRKHPSKRKFRYLRRGWNGEGKQQIRLQIDRDYRDKVTESMKNRD